MQVFLKYAVDINKKSRCLTNCDERLAIDVGRLCDFVRVERALFFKGHFALILLGALARHGTFQ